MTLKRLFDIFFSSVGIILCFPFFIIAAVLIKFDSSGPVLFTQERIGKNFIPFRIYKFRTMKHGAGQNDPKITITGDNRITRIGRLLRKYKIDELPQLFNVLKGEMSFVGPRPEIREYVTLFKAAYVKLLSIRPGITDPASICYSNEEVLLSHSDNWEDNYRKTVLPEKIKLSLHYVDNHNLITDMQLIIRTIVKTSLRIE
ncbi:MAG: sugar transferase [Thermodesulfovibrionales bacterium]|nr:sugar transferase [Thermodesulfovibrionales bacterium]